MALAGGIEPNTANQTAILATVERELAVSDKLLRELSETNRLLRKFILGFEQWIGNELLEVE